MQRSLKNILKSLDNVVSICDNQFVPYLRKPVKLDRLDHKLMVSIDRMANDFLKKTMAKTMTKEDTSALINCARLIKSLIKEQDKLVASVSDEALEKAAERTEPTGS